MGYFSTATFTQTGGTFDTHANSLVVGEGAAGLGFSPGNGTFKLEAGTLTTGAAFIGYDAQGQFTQTGGSFSTGGNPVFLGVTSTGSGT